MPLDSRTAKAARLFFVGFPSSGWAFRRDRSNGHPLGFVTRVLDPCCFALSFSPALSFVEKLSK